MDETALAVLALDARREVLARIDATRGPKVIHAAFHIQTVNNLHSRFKAFMQPFCGPATKNLSAYIAWFIARLADKATAQNEAWRRMLAA